MMSKRRGKPPPPLRSISLDQRLNFEAQNSDFLFTRGSLSGNLTFTQKSPRQKKSFTRSFSATYEDGSIIPKGSSESVPIVSASQPQLNQIPPSPDLVKSFGDFGGSTSCLPENPHKQVSVESVHRDYQSIERNDKESSTESGDSTSWKSWSKRDWLILLTQNCLIFVSCISYSLISPFFPKEANEKGAGQSTVGLIFGVYELAMFFMSPVYGALVSRYSLYILLLGALLVHFHINENVGCIDGIVSCTQ